MKSRLILAGIAVAALLMAPLAAQAADLPLQGAGLFRAELLQLDRVLRRYQRRLRFRQLGLDRRDRHDNRRLQRQWPARRPDARLQLPDRQLGLGHRSRCRLQLDQGQHRHRLRRHLRNEKHLARHGARPRRLCRLEQLAALHHRRRGLRQRQDHRRDRQRVRRPRSAGPPASASNTHSGATGPPSSNISTPISERRPAPRRRAVSSTSMASSTPTSFASA